MFRILNYIWVFWVSWVYNLCSTTLQTVYVWRPVHGFCGFLTIV